MFIPINEQKVFGSVTTLVALHRCPFITAVFFFFFCCLASADLKCQTRLPPEPTHLRPWPLQPWRCLCNHRSASSRWGKRPFCLPTVSATLPTFYCSSGWFLFFSWMSFKDGAALGGKKVYISCSPLWGLSQLGPIMCIRRKHRPASQQYHQLTWKERK